MADKNDEVRPHQSTEDTEELEADQPTSPQYQASGDQNETVGAITHCSPVEVQTESKESEIVASHRNKEDCCDSKNDTSEGSTAVIV